jgi:hypothetical protein
MLVCCDSERLRVSISQHAAKMAAHRLGLCTAILSVEERAGQGFGLVRDDVYDDNSHSQETGECGRAALIITLQF